MKQQLLCRVTATLLLLIYVTAVNAKVWRVNNASNYNGTTLWGENLGGTQSNPVFKQLQQANDVNSVVNGDTIHLEGSMVAYSVSDQINKQLVIIGPGYFLTENTNTSSNLLKAEINRIILRTGSSGTQIVGVHINGSNANGIVINNGVSNITIKRCFLESTISVGNSNFDIYILQNYFSMSAAAEDVITRSADGFPSNFIFNNNIVKGYFRLSNSNSTSIYSAAEVKNNVFDGQAIAGQPSVFLNAIVFQNNIMKNPAAAANVNNNNTTNVSFNVSSSTVNQFGTANNNIVVTNINSIFVNPATNSTDGDYQLESTWATANPGSDGAPRGAFGGASVTRRYTLSGLPPIPVIYDISTSGVAGPGGLQVTIKAKVVQ